MFLEKERPDDAPEERLLKHVGALAFDGLEDRAVAELGGGRAHGAVKAGAADDLAVGGVHHRDVALIVGNGHRGTDADRSGDRAVLEVAVDPGFAAVGAVVGVDVALVVDDVDHAGVGDRTGDAVDLRIPDELTVRRAHAHEVALEGGGAHELVVDPRTTDDVDEALDLGDAGGLTDDGVKDGLAVEAEGEKTAVGLTGEDARGGPGHLVEGLERERGSLALIVPAAFAGDDVEGGDARVGGLHHDEALADERRNVRLGGERGTPDELALGVVDLDFAAVRYDGLLHAVRAAACDDAGAGFGFPDLVARMAVKAVEAAAARGVDGIVRHGRREIAVAFADGSRPGDLRADHFTEVLQVRRFVAVGRAAAGEGENRQRCGGAEQSFLGKHRIHLVVLGFSPQANHRAAESMIVLAKRTAAGTNDSYFSFVLRRRHAGSSCPVTAVPGGAVRHSATGGSEASL